MTKTLVRAFVLLCRNGVILLPSLIVGALSAAAAYALAQSGFLSWGFFGDLNAQGPAAFWLFIGTIVAFALRILGGLIAVACTIGMAGAAWERGSAHLSDAFAALREHGVQASIALVLLFILGLIAAALVVPTFGISLLAYMVFMIYTMPAVVVGSRPAQEALVDSIVIAARHLGLTLLLAVLIVALAIAGGLLGEAAGRVPLLGEALSWLAMEAVVAYATLAVVGEYLALRPRRQAAS